MTLSRPFLLSVFLASASFLFPAAIHADDTSCAKFESGTKPVAWIYPSALPDRSKAGTVPSLSAMEKVGAYVLFDEVLYSGSTRVFSFIVMLGSKKSIDEFGSLSFTSGFSQYAEILGQVQSPDGSVRSLTAVDSQCRLLSYDGLGYNIGKGVAPKHYVVHFPGLVPGSIIQYQIALRYHGGVQDYDWLYAYSNLFTARSGGQTELSSDYNPFYDSKLRYPASMIRYTFVLPRGMKFEYKITPTDPSVTVQESKGPDAYQDRVINITTRRAAQLDEPYSPNPAVLSPSIITYVRSTEKTSLTNYQFAPKDWQEWVNREASDPLSNIVRDNNALQLLAAESHDAASPDLLTRAKAINSFMRDKVSNATGFEIRDGRGYRPPLFLVSQGRTGSRIEKALGLISLLQTAGIDAKLAYVRYADLPPIDKAYPIQDWFFGHYLAVADISGKRYYFDPVSLSASGVPPASLQGADALMMKDRKTWEWIKLPLSTDGDNSERLEFTVEAIEGNVLKGSLALKLSGSQAYYLRDNRDLTPETLRNFLLRILDNETVQGVTVNEATVEGIGNPDQPLTVKAKFSFPTGLRKLGQKLLLAPLPAINGPRVSEFVATQRDTPLYFRIPERFEVIVSFPPKLKPTAELPAMSHSEATGINYTLEYKMQDSGLEVHRTIIASGIIPAGKTSEIQAFLARAAEADRIEIPVKVAP